MKIFAHRGASGLAPENTLSAIQLALDLPIDGVEIDVYPVEDDYIVVHDRWLTRTTGLAKRFDQITLKQVKALSAGHYQGNDLSIPLLSEVLALKWGAKTLNIELKHLSNCPHFLAYLESNLVNAGGMDAESIIISSFNHHYLNSINQQKKAYNLGWLTASNYLNYAQLAFQQKCHSINVHLDVIDEAMVNHAHSLGLQVYVFTVDELEDVQLLQSMGVDGIFTNWPDRLFEFVAEQRI